MSRPPADLSEVLAVLRDEREAAREAGLEVLGVGGSLARGGAKPDSDVDLAVRQVGRTTYFRIARWEAALAEQVGRAVDLVFTETMSDVRRSYFERDLVAL